MNIQEPHEMDLFKEQLRFAMKMREAGKSDEALPLFEQAIRIAQENGWRHQEAEALNQRGTCYSAFDVPKAKDDYTASLAIFKELEEPVKVGELYTNIGNSYRMMGLKDKAIENYKSALVTLNGTDNDEMLLRVFANLAGLYFILENHFEAEKYIQEAIVLSQKINNPKLTARLLINHASYQQKIGNYEYSQTAVTTAERIALEFDDKELLAMAKECRGFGNLLQCNYEEAITYLTDVVAYFLSIGNLLLEGQVHTNIGYCFEMMGDDESAETSYRRAMEIGRQTGYGTTVAINLQNIANQRVKQNDLITAEKLLEESLEIFRTGNDRFSEAQVLKDAGLVTYKRGNQEKGLEQLEQSIAYFQSTNSHDALVITLCDLAALMLEEGNTTKAGDCVKEAEEHILQTIEKPTHLLFELTAATYLAKTALDSAGKETLLRHYRKGITLINEMKFPTRNVKVSKMLQLREELVKTKLTADELPLPTQ